MNIAIIIIIVISLISIAGFSQPELIYKYQFNAWQIKHRKEYLRWISHGFFHADWVHLFVNMYVLYFFGYSIIENFKWSVSLNSNITFLILIFSAFIASSIKSYIKENNNYTYNAIGASGAVSAIVFANILYDPLAMYSFFFIRKPILPAIVFGVLYLVYSGYMSRKNVDNIGHDAHFWGAVYGFVFPVILNPSLLGRFFNQLISIF